MVDQRKASGNANLSIGVTGQLRASGRVPGNFERGRTAQTAFPQRGIQGNAPAARTRRPAMDALRAAFRDRGLIPPRRKGLPRGPAAYSSQSGRAKDRSIQTGNAMAASSIPGEGGEGVPRSI